MRVKSVHVNKAVADQGVDDDKAANHEVGIHDGIPEKRVRANHQNYSCHLDVVIPSTLPK